MSAMPAYPVRVEAKLDSHLSRWLWLVKWILVIPHVIVLAFLWTAFIVLSIGAFFAIVFTGRYPRSIFDFNVGVLRWSWRVCYYSYSALGTDRYPPFSLGEEPDYPATLEVAYPEHLSPGLALIKWWLLAIPHYLIVGFFIGAGWLATRGGGGLILALVLIAGFALLFTERYPHGIFDFVLGLNRWAIRVAAYSALMTDAYPPFRLDLGGSEPAALPVTPSATAPTGRAGAGHVVGAVFASITCLLGVTLALSGGTMVVLDRTQRDSSGYLTTPSHHFATSGFAITTKSINVPVGGPDRLVRDLIGNVRITADSSAPVFVGIAGEREVNGYLGSVRRDVVPDPGTPSHSVVRGTGAPAAPPTVHRFWAASVVGSGRQTLDWKVRSGHWVAVVMNANARPGVFADVRVGGEVKNLGWIGAGVIAGGVLLIAAGGLGLWLALRRL